MWPHPFHNPELLQTSYSYSGELFTEKKILKKISLLFLRCKIWNRIVASPCPRRLLELTLIFTTYGCFQTYLQLFWSISFRENFTNFSLNYVFQLLIKNVFESNMYQLFNHFYLSPVERVLPFISVNTNSRHPRMLCVKFVWNRPSGFSRRSRRCEKYMDRQTDWLWTKRYHKSPLQLPAQVS